MRADTAPPVEKRAVVRKASQRMRSQATFEPGWGQRLRMRRTRGLVRHQMKERENCASKGGILLATFCISLRNLRDAKRGGKVGCRLRGR